MVVGKIKGGNFEREIAILLSKWATKGEYEDALWRSATSGGRATVAKKKGKDIIGQGDLVATRPEGKPFLDAFYPELKAYKDMEYHKIITETGFFINFWKDTVKKAAICKKQPMFIARQNYMPIVLFISHQGAETVGLVHNQSIICAPKHNALGFLFEDFVRLAKPL